MERISIRDDLNPELRNKIIELGWVCVNDFAPIGHSRTFKKGVEVVWECIHKDEVSWARASVIEQKHIGHRYYPDLMSAITYWEDRKSVV